MKIACIIHSLDGGGAERVMASLSSRLSRRGHQVTLITLDNTSSDRHAVDPGVTRRPLSVIGDAGGILARVWRRRRRLQKLASAIQTAGADVVLSFCDRTNIDVIAAAKSSGIPIVISERSDPARQWLGRFWEWHRRRQYPHAARVIALTSDAANHLQPMTGSPVAVIPSAVDRPPQEREHATAASNYRIIGVGRLEPEKGFDRLIRAFAESTESMPQWSLRVLGEGSQRSSLHQLADEFGVGDRVMMPGWVRPIWPELSEATLFVLPSRYEGFPSALLEAMAMGVPSVAVDCGAGPRAVITTEENGLLVANSVEGLSAGIKRMIDDAELRERLGQRGRTIVERFGWDAMVDAYEKVLMDAVTKERRL